MRKIPVLATFCFTLPILAQSAEPERQTIQALLAEVQQLRIAIERSTLLGTRTQITLQRIQIQEARTARLSQDLDRLHKEIADLQAGQPRIAERIKGAEEEASHSTDPGHRKAMETQVKMWKLELEHQAALEQQRRAREGELASQVQLEQDRLNELHGRVGEMERALDASLREITQPR